MENSERSEIVALYLQNKTFLFGLAYRMLGTVSDVEDIMQEVYLHLHQHDTSTIRDSKSFLAKMTINRCLDQLKSARNKREQYVGSWLPEPLLEDQSYSDPQQIAVEQESISYALIVLLQQLNPIERAVFLLHEVFGYNYAEITEIVGKNETNCRKINSRAKKRIDPEEQAVHRPQSSNSFVNAFMKAIQSGEVGSFVQLLSEDAVAYTDGGGKVNTAIRPIISRERIALYLAGILRKIQEYIEDVCVTPIAMNGETGLAISNGSDLYGITALRIVNNQIQNLYFIVNPDKLDHVRGRYLENSR